MPQVTLSVPNEKLTILRDVLKGLGIRTSDKAMLLPRNNYISQASDPLKHSVDNATQHYFSWDCNRNELEFE